jgi:hypothetical protein
LQSATPGMASTFVLTAARSGHAASTVAMRVSPNKNSHLRRESTGGPSARSKCSNG